MTNNPTPPIPEALPTPPRNLRGEKLRVAVPAAAIAFIFLATVLLQLLLGVIIGILAPSLADQAWFSLVFSSIPMYTVAMPLSLLLYRLIPQTSTVERQNKKLGFLAFLGMIALCFALTFVGSIVSNIVTSLIGALTGEIPEYDLQEITVNSPLWANLLFIGILAPIMEEIFYRKLIIDRLLPFGDLPAVLLSGIAFGLLHGNFYQFFYAAAIGILFGYLYIYTGKLRYTVLLHMIVNLIGGVYAPAMLKMMDLEALESGSFEGILQNLIPLAMMLGYYAFLGACLVGTPIALVLLWKHIKFRKAEAPLTKKEWCRVLLINPGIWFFAAVTVLMFWLNTASF